MWLCVRFEVQIKFSIPNIIVEPTLDVCQKVIVDVTNAILEATSGECMCTLDLSLLLLTLLLPKIA